MHGKKLGKQSSIMALLTMAAAASAVETSVSYEKGAFSSPLPPIDPYGAGSFFYQPVDDSGNILPGQYYVALSSAPSSDMDAPRIGPPVSPFTVLYPLTTSLWKCNLNYIVPDVAPPLSECRNVTDIGPFVYTQSWPVDGANVTFGYKVTAQVAECPDNNDFFPDDTSSDANCFWGRIKGDSAAAAALYPSPSPLPVPSKGLSDSQIGGIAGGAITAVVIAGALGICWNEKRKRQAKAAHDEKGLPLLDAVVVGH
ncbi:MAG: hypothetical protein K0R66_1072 [Gammaproteobacteria bacterium]|jgi:hypothetical protein|nr:hypothetical protein [Gammaproteobacteria bacterium]